MRDSKSRSDLWRSRAVTLAQLDDAKAIAALLNAAYRSGEGWTHEQRLVSGLRASESSVNAQIAAATGRYLLMRQEQLVACIYTAPIKADKGSAMVGSFAVQPRCQGAGLGAILLAKAEQYAIEHFAAKTIYMDVLAPRSELIAYYQRRGYLLTGEHHPFPLEANAGQPFDAALQVVRLMKRV